MTVTSGIDVSKVVAPSPNIAGGVWRAPLGTTLPVDTTTALTTPNISLGYIGDAGLNRQEQRPQTKTYAWGGWLLASLQQSYSMTFKFTLVQVLDPDVLKAVHSDTNVTVTAATESSGTLTKVSFNPTLNQNAVWNFEGFYQATTMRVSVPIGRVTEPGDLLWSNKQIAGYAVTLESFPDSQGNFGYQITDDGVLAIS